MRQQCLRPGKTVRGHAEGLLEGDVAVPGILDPADLSKALVDNYHP